jgi:hypothetical protein
MRLASKVLKVSQAIGCVEKNGLNAHFKFKYQAWDDVLPAVRNACIEHGVQITPTVLDARNDNGHVIVHMMFLVKDVDSDQVDEFAWFGEAKGNDDKGIQKAITSCTKYALLKYFMIPIVDDTDTDAHGPASPAAKPKKAEPTKVDSNSARSVFVKKVYNDWVSIGGTLSQFEQLKTKLASIKFPTKATDLINHAMAEEGCATVEEVHRWIASTHKELTHPFKLEDNAS